MDKYVVKPEQRGSKVRLVVRELHENGSPAYYPTEEYLVEPPNFFEKLLGFTYERKVRACKEYLEEKYHQAAAKRETDHARAARIVEKLKE